MNTLTNISQRQLNAFQENAEIYRRRYGPLETAMWRLEEKVIPVYVVPITHPTIQYGLEYGLSWRMTAPELYGILRGNIIEKVLLTETEPIMGCICVWNVENLNPVDAYPEDWHPVDAHPEDWNFVISWEQHSRLLNYFLRDILSSEKKTNWKKEGF